MGKGKRLREERAALPPVRMGRGEFKAYMCAVIERVDEPSLYGLQQLFLTACGVIDQDGNLTEEYQESPYWGVDSKGRLESIMPAIKKEEE